MYISAFWVGVVSLLLFEIGVFIAYLIWYYNFKKGREN